MEGDGCRGLGALREEEGEGVGGKGAVLGRRVVEG